MDLGNHIAIVRVRKHKFNLNTRAPHMKLLNFSVIDYFSLNGLCKFLYSKKFKYAMWMFRYFSQTKISFNCNVRMSGLLPSYAILQMCANICYV